MGKFRLEIDETASKDFEAIYKSGQKATINRLEKIISELTEHPTAGT